MMMMMMMMMSDDDDDILFRIPYFVAHPRKSEVGYIPDVVESVGLIHW